MPLCRPVPFFIAGAAVVAATFAPAAAQLSDDDLAQLREAALKDELAWEITEELTTEVGPRYAGSPAEARARDWAVDKLTSLGFEDVRVETFEIPYWVRGEEKAEIVSPFPQELILTALGNSGSTPKRGLTAEVVGFRSVYELEQADDAAVDGKIVFIDQEMPRAQNGIGYGQFGAPRRQGPTVASRKGAAAIVVRSLGTDHNRTPHTGVQSFADGVDPIPAAALAAPDAEQLTRMLERGRPITMKLTLTPKQAGKATSGNVIVDVPGTDPEAGMVLVACHLDSWDNAPGALDDASGCGIVTAAAKRVIDAGPHRRPIRIVWFGAEETGLWGGFHYLREHGDEDHAMIAESDSGADRVWRFNSKMPESADPALARMTRALEPLGVARGDSDQASGSDIGPLSRSGVSTLQLQQDLNRYFDYHHTSNDTLDKVDPEQLRQNVAAWTVITAVSANAPEDLVTPRADDTASE